MANLVPLQIDKDTGEIVAKGIVVTGGSGSGSGGGLGYLYERVVATSTWSINHGLDSTQVLVQVYDETGEFTLPDTVNIIDSNNVEITFAAAMSGTAHLIFFVTG